MKKSKEKPKKLPKLKKKKSDGKIDLNLFFRL